MKALSIILAAVFSASVVVASTPHDTLLLARHARLARSNAETTLVKRAARKSCRKKPSSKENKPAEPKETKPKETKPKEPAPSPQANSAKFATGGNNGGAGLLRAQTNCGDLGATKEITRTSGPNGAIDKLNCGVEGGGWKPPYVKLPDLQTMDLGAALAKGDSPFKACGPFIDFFYRFGGEFGIPPILLAAFAMQESSCRPDTVGGGGEQGLMQLTHEKCGEAPNGNCKDPAYNIRTAAAFFRRTVDSKGGNVIAAIGAYNGWPDDMTIASATRAATGPCCLCQNNLDYVHQFVNGWCQGIDPRAQGLGKYFNLLKCQH